MTISPKDKIIMSALWKKIIQDSDTDEIHRLYKKYIDPSAPRPISSCGFCPMSLSGYYDKLRDYYAGINI